MGVRERMLVGENPVGTLELSEQQSQGIVGERYRAMEPFQGEGQVEDGPRKTEPITSRNFAIPPIDPILLVTPAEYMRAINDGHHTFLSDQGRIDAWRIGFVSGVKAAGMGYIQWDVWGREALDRKMKTVATTDGLLLLETITVTKKMPPALAAEILRKREELEKEGWML